MRIGEALLRRMSRPPDAQDFDPKKINDVPGQELAVLRREFSGFSSLVRGKRVVDFGSGAGLQSLALAQEEQCFVCGVESNPRSLADASMLATKKGVPGSSVVFIERPTSEMLGSFDIVISQDSMEHFSDPVAVLNQMKAIIHRGGRILITFGPPWYAPYGSHMHYFCKVPWINLLFSERTVMRVRSLYRGDGATRYEDVESGLNRMTVGKFERIVRDSGLAIETRTYRCVKGADWLGRIPVARELIINNVSCILKHA